MNERQPIYEPYGPEWVAEMMKHRKTDIVGLFQAFATARPPVDSVGVDRERVNIVERLEAVSTIIGGTTPPTLEECGCAVQELDSIKAALSDSKGEGMNE